jgi:hypothetical protein
VVGFLAIPRDPVDFATLELRLGLDALTILLVEFSEPDDLPTASRKIK